MYDPNQRPGSGARTEISGSMMFGALTQNRWVGPNWTALDIYQLLERGTPLLSLTMLCIFLGEGLKTAQTLEILQLSGLHLDGGTHSKTWALRRLLDLVTA